jgi:hypothetical protein
MKIGDMPEDDKVALRRMIDSYGISYIADSEDFAVALERINKHVDYVVRLSPDTLYFNDLVEQLVEQVNYVIDRFKALEECDNDDDMNQIMEDIPNMLRDIITLVEDA